MINSRWMPALLLVGIGAFLLGYVTKGFAFESHFLDNDNRLNAIVLAFASRGEGRPVEASVAQNTIRYGEGTEGPPLGESETTMPGWGSGSPASNSAVFRKP